MPSRQNHHTASNFIQKLSSRFSSGDLVSPELKPQLNPPQGPCPHGRVKPNSKITIMILILIEKITLVIFFRGGIEIRPPPCSRNPVFYQSGWAHLAFHLSPASSHRLVICASASSHLRAKGSSDLHKNQGFVIIFRGPPPS